MNGNIYISELSTSRHIFKSYHFCRGNSSRRKSRFGVILKGSGTYIYLNKRLHVEVGDVVFIPENVYCYSEWRGDPEIEVVYLSAFMHCDGYRYDLQLISCSEDEKSTFLHISSLLSADSPEELRAYSLFYGLLQGILPRMEQSSIAFDKTLQTAIAYLTEHWNEEFSIAELAKACCVSESTLYHLFQKGLGETPIRFLNSIRINIAIEHLESSNYSISTICRMVGFRSENHFRKVFADFTGTTPLKYRKSK